MINYVTVLLFLVVVRGLTNGTLVNIARVNSTENEISISNRTNVSVNPVVNLTLVKVSEVSDDKVGYLVNFTVVVANFGPSNALALMSVTFWIKQSNLLILTVLAPSLLGILANWSMVSMFLFGLLLGF